MTRLRGLLDAILNCTDPRCYLCSTCLAAAHDVDRPTEPQTAEEREAFFVDIGRP